MSAGRLVRTVCCLALLLMAASWAWASGGAPGLLVSAPSPELADHVGQIVAQVGPRLEAWVGARPRALRIMVAASEQDFLAEMARVQGPRWASGLAVPGQGLIILRSPRQLTRPEDFEPLLVHELTHLYLSARLGKREHPLWLEEGLAMYAAGDSSLERGAVMGQAVLQNRLIPFEQLERGLPEPAEQVALAYAQSLYMVAYLARHYGDQGLRQVIDSLARGRELTQALYEATGKGLAALSKDFKEEMESRFSWIALISAGGTIWAVVSLLVAVGLVRRRWEERRRRRAMGEPPQAGPNDFMPRRWPPPRPGRVQGPVGLRGQAPPPRQLPDQVGEDNC